MGSMIICSADCFTYYLPTGECLNSTTKPLNTYGVYLQGETIMFDRREIKQKLFPVVERRKSGHSLWFAAPESEIFLGG